MEMGCRFCERVINGLAARVGRGVMEMGGKEWGWVAEE